MSLYVNSSATWTQVPQEPERVYVNNGGTWTQAKEAWCAEETTPAVYQWTRAWRVPEPPVGVVPDLEQTEISGGDVQASWINTTGDFSILVEFEINSVSWGTVTRSPASTTALLLAAELADQDDVRARMRYFEGSVQGDWSAWSAIHTYQG